MNKMLNQPELSICQRKGWDNAYEVDETDANKLIELTKLLEVLREQKVKSSEELQLARDRIQHIEQELERCRQN